MGISLLALIFGKYCSLNVVEDCSHPRGIDTHTEEKTPHLHVQYITLHQHIKRLDKIFVEVSNLG